MIINSEGNQASIF